MGNTNYTHKGQTGVPTAQNNGMLFNLIYTRTDGPWVVTGYGQYSQRRRATELGSLDFSLLRRLGQLDLHG